MMLRGRPRTRHFQIGGATGGALTPQQQMAAMGAGMPAPMPVNMGMAAPPANLQATPMPGGGMPPPGGGGAPPMMPPGGIPPGAGVPPMMPPGMGPGSPPPVPPAATAPVAPGAAAMGAAAPNFAAAPMPVGGLGAAMPGAGRGLNPALVQQMAARRAAMAQPGMAPGAGAGVPGAGFARGGKVRVRISGDTPVRKRSRDAQWGQTKAAIEDVPEVLKKAKGGVLRRRPPVPVAPKKRGAAIVPPMPPGEVDMGTPLPGAAGPPPPGGQPVAVGMKSGGKWIGRAIQHPGSLRRSLHVKKGETIPAKTLEAAASKPGKLGRRARMAETLEKLRPGGKARGGKVLVPASGAAARARRAEGRAEGGEIQEHESRRVEAREKRGQPAGKERELVAGSEKRGNLHAREDRGVAARSMHSKGGECKKMAAGGAAKERRGFPHVEPPPAPRIAPVHSAKRPAAQGSPRPAMPEKSRARRGIASKGDRFTKTFAKGGKIRGCGAAERGCQFSGIY